MNTDPRWPVIAWWFLLALMITDRILLLFGFGFTHTGSDDVLFWNIANDLLHGHFREPYVYGQNYNPPFESLFVAPILKDLQAKQPPLQVFVLGEQL